LRAIRCCFHRSFHRLYNRRMCGRFTRNYTWAQIHAMYSLTSPASNLQPSFNICPTDTVVAVTNHELVAMRWGLIPGWWSRSLKDFKIATFNAGAETVAKQPVFRSTFRKSRCLLPASGYYEWKITPDGKQPFYFTRRDSQVMTIAGLCNTWLDRTSGERRKTCTMLTTEPNKFVAEVHDRMPVILGPQDFQQWEKGDVKDAAALMVPAAEDLLVKWPVSTRVNSSRADGDDATLIDKVGA
jgi:putative SOS response-associated peptidase YedK